MVNKLSSGSDDLLQVHVPATKIELEAGTFEIFKAISNNYEGFFSNWINDLTLSFSPAAR